MGMTKLDYTGLNLWESVIKFEKERPIITHAKKLAEVVKDTYREVGIHQGECAAYVYLHTQPTYMELIDVNLSNYCMNIPTAKLLKANDFVKDKIVHTTFIDALKDSTYVYNALNFYKDYTTNYIMVHDTVLKGNVRDGVVKFLDENPKWKIVSEETDWPGFVLMEYNNGNS